jgi:hypothetical protein
MGKSFTLVLSALCGAMLVACNGGGGSSNGNSSFVLEPTPPNPVQPVGTYNGLPYSALGQPPGLTTVYPNDFWPNNLISLQIAYGKNSELSIANLTAYVRISDYLCSATPVKYDSVSNTTFLIGAAHCFVEYKDSATTLNRANLSSTSVLSIYHGVYAESSTQRTQYVVKAVYLRQDYCYNATFGVGGECPNFSPSYGVANGQGNDIAVIQIQGHYANQPSESYPQVVPASEYPIPYTAAPVLSVGYGINTQTQNGDAKCSTSTEPCGTMFYTANYQYWQQDTTGYHYLYNSFYNNGGLGASGYGALICGGDSGGGDLFWTGSKWILLSEHTYGPGGVCGTFYNYLPNGATNVSAYYDWIMPILNSADPISDCQNSTNGVTTCVTNG